MGKVAKLVSVSLMTRVIVEENADDEVVWSAAVPRLLDVIRHGGMDNIELIENDTECPYDGPDQYLSSKSIHNTSDDENGGNRKVIGYQIVSDDSARRIPDGLYSFVVLTDAAANMWLKMDRLKPTGNWIKIPVYSGDVEDPVIFNSIAY